MNKGGNYMHNTNFPPSIDPHTFSIIAVAVGYACVSKDTQKKFGLMIEEYLKSRENLKHVFMLVDYRHKPTEDDVLMYEFLKYYNLDITIVATKYDKVSKNSRIKQDKLIKDTLKFDDNEFITFSTVTKKGRSEVLSILEEKI